VRPHHGVECRGRGLVRPAEHVRVDRERDRRRADPVARDPRRLARSDLGDGDSLVALVRLQKIRVIAVDLVRIRPRRRAMDQTGVARQSQALASRATVAASGRRAAPPQSAEGDAEGLVFTNSRDKAWSKVADWPRIRQAAALADFRLHDLRHSSASIMVSGGLSLAIVGKVLGASSRRDDREICPYCRPCGTRRRRRSRPCDRHRQAARGELIEAQ
jgi:hypothetical protein